MSPPNKHAPNPPEYQCLLGQYLLERVQTPLFVLQSLEDDWVIRHVLGVDCRVRSQQDYASEIIYNCTSAQRARIQAYKLLVKHLVVSNLQLRNDSATWLLDRPLTSLLFDVKNFNRDAQQAVKQWAINRNLLSLINGTRLNQTQIAKLDLQYNDGEISVHKSASETQSDHSLDIAAAIEQKLNSQH